MFTATKGQNSIGRPTVHSASLIESGWNTSRALSADPWIFVAATSGTNYDTGMLPDDVVEQAKQAIANVRHALAEMGASMNEVVRSHLIVPNAADLPRLRELMAEAFDGGCPVQSTLCCALPKPSIKIEIEVTALRRN